MSLRLILASAAGLALTFSTTSVWAGSKIVSIGDAVVDGSVESNANQNRDPWVAQVFSSGVNECLRIEVTSQGADLEATLVSPSGLIWQDDDSGGSLRPLINAITDTRGWYPLVLSHFSTDAINADFSMSVRRLPSTDVLCSPPTEPRIAAMITAAPKEQALGPAPSGGANSR